MSNEDLTAQADRRDVGLLEALRARNAEGLALGIKLPEAAKLLGVSQRHLYSQAVGGFVPSYRIGAALRFSPVALREWVANQSAISVAWQPARPVIAAQARAPRTKPARGSQTAAAVRDRLINRPAPKTVHVRRAGEWVTQLPSTIDPG